MNITFSRRRQALPEEFLRQLPEAFGGRSYEQIDGGIIEISEGPKHRIRLNLDELDERELGALNLPMLRVDFVFEGYSPEQVARLMDHFDACTMRGAGGP